MNWSVALFFSMWVLLPFGRLAELPVLGLSIIGVYVLIHYRDLMFGSKTVRTFSICFGLYFLMLVVASLDSYWANKSWLITLSSLRFYFAGLALLFYLKDEHVHKLQRWLLILVTFWTLDALIQYVLGYDLFGITSYPGRLSGVFGMNVKLGPILALLLPFVLMALRESRSIIRWLIVALLVLVIVLSGTRSAWLMMIFVLVTYWWFHVKGRRWLLLIKTMLLSLVACGFLWQFSDDFQTRVSRSMAVFQGDVSGLDFALADRLPIWKTAINMFKAHPINGVGPRAFRKAYTEYATEEDVWIIQNKQGLHAHHWFLELLAETGLVGLLIFGMLSYKLLTMIWLHKNKVNCWSPTVSLMAAFLPVVSLYSLFSSFWSLSLWWVLMMLFLVVKDE